MVNGRKPLLAEMKGNSLEQIRKAYKKCLDFAKLQAIGPFISDEYLVPHPNFDLNDAFALCVENHILLKVDWG
jgi:hypothetical protein